MTKDLEIFSELFTACKTIMLPKERSNCYAVYSKEEYDSADPKLNVDGHLYKHRLYLYKNLENSNHKTLSIITLQPNWDNHIEHNSIENLEKLAETDYGAIEVYSLFTLRTVDPIDALLQDSILDITRIEFGKNDILLDLNTDITRTSKHQNLTDDELLKINTVKQIKTQYLLDFLSERKNNVYELKNNQLVKKVF